MSEADNNSAIGEPQFGSAQPADGERTWIPRLLGIAVVAVLLVTVYGIGRHMASEAAANQSDPYLAKLQVSGLHMATAENFAGGHVTYIEGHIANTGDRKVTDLRVQVIFKNSIGEVSQKDLMPVMVQLSNPTYADFGPVDRAPLGPGQGNDFRLTLEHVTLDWDGQLPEVKVVGFTAK